MKHFFVPGLPVPMDPGLRCNLLDPEGEGWRCALHVAHAVPGFPAVHRDATGNHWFETYWAGDALLYNSPGHHS